MTWTVGKIALLILQGVCWLIPPFVLVYKGGWRRNLAGLLWFWLIPVVPVFLAEAVGLITTSVHDDGHILWLGVGWTIFLPVLALKGVAGAVRRHQQKVLTRAKSELLEKEEGC